MFPAGAVSTGFRFLDAVSRSVGAVCTLLLIGDGNMRSQITETAVEASCASLIDDGRAQACLRGDVAESRVKL